MINEIMASAAECTVNIRRGQHVARGPQPEAPLLALN